MEENLIKKSKEGNKEAFAKLIELYERKLFVIAKSRLEQDADIKDAVQETIYQAYTNIVNLRNNSSFNAWITSVLINNCNNIKRDKIKTFYSYDDLECENYYETIDEYIEVDSDIDFFNLIDFLPTDEKTIVVLYFSRGYTTSEISNILNINENTVRTKIRRIKGKIKNRYDGEFYNVKNG